MDEILAARRILAVVAHYDDEALFCGGTLVELARRHRALHIAVVTDVADTNPPPNGTVEEAEIARRQRRLSAFERVCQRLQAGASHLRQPNLRAGGEGFEAARSKVLAALGSRLPPLLDRFRPDLVLTHGREGEYGHPQHVATHRAVFAAWPGLVATFAAEGRHRLDIDWPRKLELLAFYREGTTQSARWDPRRMKPYQPWCRDYETFDCRGSVTAGR